MSSTQVQRPIKVINTDRSISHGRTQSKDQDRQNNRRSSTISGPNMTKKNANNEGRFKFGRKRAQTFSTGNGKFFPPYKRRKKEGIIPPTKFLLGGNIYDPLNLNSLQDEEINRAMNAVTPKSSPVPTPKHRKGAVEVIIPPNINDPLNLIDCDDDAKYEEQLVSPTKKVNKKRNRKKKRNSSSGGSTKDDSIEGAVSGIVPEEGAKVEESKNDSENAGSESTPASAVADHPVGKEVRDLSKALDLPLLKDKDKKPRKSTEDSGKEGKRNRKVDLKDKIVSPVIPQPGTWKRPGHGSAADGRYNRFWPGVHWQQQKAQVPPQTPKFQPKNAKFQYGNYNRYYGYRNTSNEGDLRLKSLSERRALFYDKDVLDIGCNIGHITLSVARDFGARSVVGLDIDRNLINIARKNIRHYVNCAESPPTTEGASGARRGSKCFPISMPILYGPVDIPGLTRGESPSVRKKFPRNVTFVQGNYVLDSDTLLLTEQPQFDIILCLSITKWLHLNWGDAGLKQAFKRMFTQLRPGGKLILEAQAWDSYKRKRTLTETIFKNYNSIEFLPHKFTQYLLSSEIGFTKCEVIDTPYHHSRGFQRPIQLFSKGETPLYSATPSYATGVANKPLYTSVAVSSRDAETPSDTNTPLYAASTSNTKTPVYTAVVVSGSSRDAETPSSANTPCYTGDGTVASVPVYAAAIGACGDVDDESADTVPMITEEVATECKETLSLQDSKSEREMCDSSITEKSIDVDIIDIKDNISETANRSDECDEVQVSGMAEAMEVSLILESDHIETEELGSQVDEKVQVSGRGSLEEVDTRQTLDLVAEPAAGNNTESGTITDQTETSVKTDVCDIVINSTS